MSRPKGMAKTGGRTVGTPNKRTVFLSNELARVGFNWAQEFKGAYETVNMDKLQVLVALLPYLSPKMGEMQVETPSEELDVTPPEIEALPTADLMKAIK